MRLNLTLEGLFSRLTMYAQRAIHVSVTLAEQLPSVSSYMLGTSVEDDFLFLFLNDISCAPNESTVLANVIVFIQLRAFK